MRRDHSARSVLESPKILRHKATKSRISIAFRNIPMTPLVVIPARLAATRLPDKPLADIHGVPMIVHVWRRAVEAAIGPVVVACGDSAILAAIESVGGRAVLTDPDHPSGSDRVWEAVERVDPAARHDIIVNVQGDLPTLGGDFIRRIL